MQDTDATMITSDRSKMRARGFKTQAIDMIIDGRIFFDISIGRRDIGFGLIVIVIGDEILNRVFRKELLVLRVELCGQNFIGRQNQRGFLNLRDDVRGRERFAAAGDAQENLMARAVANTLDQFLNGCGLVAGRFEGRFEFKCAHTRLYPGGRKLRLTDGVAV